MRTRGDEVALRVVVADDDADIRSALRAVLDDDERFHVVAEACDAAQALEATERERPDVVLLDVRMPGGGVQAAHAIRSIGLHITVIAISARVDAGLVAAMLQAGARGVFVKGRLGRSFADLVVRCSVGEVILATPSAAEGLRVFAGAQR